MNDFLYEEIEYEWLNGELTYREALAIWEEIEHG